MKRVVFVTLMTVLAGTASAAILVPSPEPESSQVKSTKLDAGPRSSAPTSTETRRPPVPLLPSPRRRTPEITSLAEPPADQSQSTAKLQQPGNSPKPAVEREAGKSGRDVASGDNSCRGRSLRSVTIEPNGTVHFQC